MAGPVWQAVQVGLTARCDRHASGDDRDLFAVICCEDCRRRQVQRANAELERLERAKRTEEQC
jgi:hypothetical protein